MIPRSTYIGKLDRWRDRDVIKVVTGVRRCGKSCLLALYAKMLADQGVSRNRIIAINLEQLENEHLLNYKALHDEVLSRTQSDGMNYVFIDEVQNVPNFQKTIDSLYTRSNIDLYITGSNAMLLSGSLATLLSGRYIEIKMTPLSFAEYVSGTTTASSTGKTSDLRRLYSRYISQGGFPATIEFSQDSLALHDYLDGIANTVFFKDVAQRLNAANTMAIEALATFMYDNIANLTSVKGIADTLTANGIKISTNTVAEYLSALANSYLIYPAKRYDVRGKRILKLQAKYYGVDMGMRRLLLSGHVRDNGRILENVVFLELLRRYGEVNVGRINNMEIDFVVQTPDGVEYYQVAETVAGEKTLERELASLRAVRDNNPKFLITLDETDPISHDGIIQMNALDWMLEGDDPAD